MQYTERDIPTIIWIWMKIFVGKGSKKPPYWPTPRNDGLHFLSLFRWLLARGTICKISCNLDIAIDYWAFGWSLLSFLVFILYMTFSDSIGFGAYLLILIAMWRVIEIIIVQAGIMLFDRYQKLLNTGKYTVRSLHRIALLLLHNYFEIIFWFALLYRFFQVECYIIDLQYHASLPEVALRVLHFSFYTMTTFAELNDITSVKVFGWSELFFLFQAAVGLFMALLILARFIGSIPKPDTEDKFEIKTASQN
jgi:hypothetical protein